MNNTSKFILILFTVILISLIVFIFFSSVNKKENFLASSFIRFPYTKISDNAPLVAIKFSHADEKSLQTNLSVPHLKKICLKYKLCKGFMVNKKGLPLFLSNTNPIYRNVDNFQDLYVKTH